MPWGHRCRVGVAAIRPSGQAHASHGPGGGAGNTVPGWQDCAQILCSRWTARIERCHGARRRAAISWGHKDCNSLRHHVRSSTARQSARLAFPRIRRKLAPPPQGERHAPLPRLDCHPPHCACRRRRRARRRLLRRRERADQAQDGAQLEVPGAAGLLLRRRGQGVLQGRRPRRRDRPGRRLGDADPQGRERHLRRRLRRHQRADRLRREAPGGGADRGLCDVQPAALHGRREGRQPDQDAEGLRGQHDRRRGERRRAQAVPGAVQEREDRLRQGQDHQHAAEPARADAHAGPGRRRVRLRQHHPLQRQADRDRPRQAAPLHQLRRLRHGPLFQRHHRLEEAREGEARGGARLRAGAQQGGDRIRSRTRRWRSTPCSSASR